MSKQQLLPRFSCHLLFSTLCCSRHRDPVGLFRFIRNPRLFGEQGKFWTRCCCCLCVLFAPVSKHWKTSRANCKTCFLSVNITHCCFDTPLLYCPACQSIGVLLFGLFAILTLQELNKFFFFISNFGLTVGFSILTLV